MRQRDLRVGSVALLHGVNETDKDLYTIIGVALLPHRNSTLYRVMMLSHKGIITVRSDSIMEQVVIP